MQPVRSGDILVEAVWKVNRCATCRATEELQGRSAILPTPVQPPLSRRFHFPSLHRGCPLRRFEQAV